jgi:hypothetical protein
MFKRSTTILAAATVFASVCCHAAQTTTDGWNYIDNGSIRIGVDRSRGACIGYFGESSTGRNLLNHFDEGRFIQQSYYGQKDGSNWNGNPWVYNPIQGGSWKGVPAEVTEFSVHKSPFKITAAITPRHWAYGKLCPEMEMQESIRLDDKVATINFKMSYNGPDQGKPRHQEMPAVFVDGVLENFVYTKDGQLTRAAPRILAENGRDGVDGLAIDHSSSEWVAYLDENDWGIGIYTPGTSEFTCYRALGNGTTGPSGSACSYVAPIRTFALTTGLKMDYTVYLTIGTLEEIQARFEALH